MGNCHKSRLCEFLHNHCRFLFFGRYQSIFDHSENNNSGNSQNNPSYNYSNSHSNCDYHSSRSNHYPGGSDLGSSTSRSERYQKNPAANLAGSSGYREKMHRQRSASHCPHQIRLNAEADKSPGGRKCCCPGSGSGKGPEGKSKNDQMTPEQVGRSKRASSLKILNKRFNFHFTDQNPKEPKERRNSNSSSSAQLRQPTSATYHHTSSANHQIIYHSNLLNRSSRKQKHHTLKLNELDDRSLLHVFEYLSLRDRMYYERVCRRWQALIRASLLAPASLKIGEHSVKCNCTCAYFPSWDLPPVKKFIRDEAGYIVYPNSLLRYLLSMCRKLKCINFSHCYLDDQALQIIMTYSDNIECLHLNDIRLEEGNDDLDMDMSSPSTAATNNDLHGSTSNNRTAHSSDELLSNGHHHSEETTVTSAVSAFATEQLAVFGGLMRKLSTRKPNKKDKTANINENLNSPTAAINQQAVKYTSGKQSNGQSNQNSGSSINLHQNGHSSRRVQETQELDRSLKVTRSSPSPSPAKSSNTHVSNGTSGRHRGSKGAVDLAVGLHCKLANNLSYPNITATPSSTTYQTPDIQSPCSNATVAHSSASNLGKCACLKHHDSKCSLNDMASCTTTGGVTIATNGPASGKTSNSNIASAVTAAALSNAIGQRRAQQRRREWSRHRSSHNRTLQLLAQQQQHAVQMQNQNNLSDDEPLSTTAIDTTTTASNANNNLGNEDSNSSSAAKRHLVSPNVAPNISSLQTDSDLRYTSHSNSNSSNGSSSSLNGPISHPPQPIHARNHHNHTHQKDPCTGNPTNNSIDNALAISRFDDIQAFVEQEQRRRECRQSHLLHWKMFAKKLGSQIKVLSIGGLTAVDQVVIDLLLKYCVALDELRINNEIDILSYLTIIKHTVKRIYINCEHGIGLECVSLLAFRNYAEKVINLGRVDVPPELIDSVISTIGSNFSNLRSLHLRLHNADIDVATPANLLFDNLYELNLQFVSGNVDQPFRKLIQLGWSSVKSLTIQYASITEESVRSIGENLPQLNKLILHAVEFRCDHLGRRYGHRICTNCSHSVWKCIASLPYLTQLKLHRVIIDAEICKALSRMSRLTNLDLNYCSNVSDNVVSVCTELARRNLKRRFYLNIVSRGFITYKPPTESHNLFIDIKVAAIR